MVRFCVACLALVLAASTLTASLVADGAAKRRGPLDLGIQEEPRYAPSLVAIVNQIASAGQARGMQVPAIPGENQTYTAINIEFIDAAAAEKFSNEHAHIITRFDRFVDAFVPADQKIIDEIAKSEDVVWLEIDVQGIVPPPSRPIPTGETPRQLPEEIVRGGFEGLTGSGVIIAICDTGLDFRHPDFITYDENGLPTSRILYFWDTASDCYANGVGQPAPITYPNGAPIGTIYSRDDLTAELRSARSRIPSWDLNGHGTACAGVAAGNGNASNGEHAGVAPQADIIAVRLGTLPMPMINNDYLLGAACEWLDKVAGEQPLVISCSFGAQIGGRDGATITERQLDARFPADRVGRAICFSAGNSGKDRIHAEVQFGGEKAATRLEWESTYQTYLEVYLQTDKLDDLVMGPLGESKLSNLNSFIHPITKQVIVQMTCEGSGGLYLYSKSGDTYVADAYLSAQGLEGLSFADHCYRYGKLIGSPANAASVITIGSYDWNDQFDKHGQVLEINDVFGEPIRIGQLSTYSSPGPQRLGATKPEIVAPGQWHTVPAPRNAYILELDSSGMYQNFNGTSAATPYTAGIIALIFEKKPDLTLGQLRELLTGNLTKDQFTGEVPNPGWGYGKLDVKAIKSMLAAIE